MYIITHVDKRCEVIMKHKKFIDELKGLGVVLVDGTNHYNLCLAPYIVQSPDRRGL